MQQHSKVSIQPLMRAKAHGQWPLCHGLSGALLQPSKHQFCVTSALVWMQHTKSELRKVAFVQHFRFKGINRCHFVSSVLKVLVPAAGSCQVPGGGRRFRGLSLDLSLRVELPSQGRLDLGRNVWRRLADLHGRFLELDRVPAVHLHFQRILLLHLPHFAVGGQQRVGLRRLGETNTEAIFHMS